MVLLGVVVVVIVVVRVPSKSSLFNTLFFSHKKAPQNPKPRGLFYYDMSTLAETLADPSRPSFLFGGSIFRVVFLLALRASLSASSSSCCALFPFGARAHPNPSFGYGDRTSNPIGAHKTGARGQKARAQTQRAVLGLPSLARFTRAPKGG